MNPTQPPQPQPQSDNSASQPQSAMPPFPPAPQPAPPQSPSHNKVPLFMVWFLFILLILGGILAYILRPKPISMPATHSYAPSSVPTQAQQPAVSPTKTPEEQQAEQVDIGSSSADINSMQQNVNKL